MKEEIYSVIFTFALLLAKQTLFVSLLGKRYSQVRVDRNIGAVVYAGLVLQVFIFASLRSVRFICRGSRTDHIGNGVVGWDEGKDVFGVRDDDVQHVGLIGGEHAFHRWF